MVFTRLGYLVILGIIGATVVAMALVFLRSGDSSGEDEPFEVPFETVINYARYGAVTRIEANGADLTIYISDEVDVSQLNTDTHVWVSTTPDGLDVETALTEAGITVGDDGGLPVVRQ